jgi:anaerobic ribonucleoside-triphosphate reductase activating protein
MLKYYNAMVVFEEIPDEITLAINITNCPCHCPGCHSKFLWEDVGTELTDDELRRIMDENDGITCVCFMGGDANPKEVNDLAGVVITRNTCRQWPLKVAWYSGMDELSDEIDIGRFDYIKLGHYDNELGPLNKKTTNQRLYQVTVNNKDKKFELNDITYKMQS